MNHSKNITNIGAALGALLAALTTRSEELVILPEITVTGSTATDTGYRADTATTATKTDTPIFDLPVSIQVVPRELMDDRQVIRVEDALETVSGVDLGPFRGVFDAAVVRGFVVTPYRDGFRTRPIGAIASNTAHLERVEVLKGPASVLYGRTDPGGLINLVTKRPLATPYYSLQQQLGSFDLYRTTLDATGPITDDDTLLYRVNLAYENIGSFRDFLDQEGVFVAPVLTWNLSDRTRVIFDLQYFHGDFPRDRDIVALGDRPAPIPIERSLGEPFNKDEFDDLQAGFLWQHDFNQDWTLRHHFTTEQLNLVTEEVSARSTFLPDNRSVERSYFAQDEDSEFYYTALELTGRFHTWGLRHTTLLGADYYYNEFDVPLTVTSFAPIDIFNPVYGAPSIEAKCTVVVQTLPAGRSTSIPPVLGNVDRHQLATPSGQRAAQPAIPQSRG